MTQKHYKSILNVVYVNQALYSESSKVIRSLHVRLYLELDCTKLHWVSLCEKDWPISPFVFYESKSYGLEQHGDSFIFEWTIALNTIVFFITCSHVIILKFTFGFCVANKWFPPLKCKPDSLVFQINDPPLCSLTDWLLGCFQVTFAFEQLQPINPSVILPDNQSSTYALHFSVISKSLLLMQINNVPYFFLALWLCSIAPEMH